MKKYGLEFLKRGLMASVGGPVILAVVYGILGLSGEVQAFRPGEVCLGILTAALMAFVAAGLTVVYTIERLPLGWAIGIHGLVLYADYILIYLLNGWLKREVTPVLIFTAAFAVGYGVIWLIVYCCIRSDTNKVNRGLPGAGA